MEESACRLRLFLRISWLAGTSIYFGVGAAQCISYERCSDLKTFIKSAGGAFSIILYGILFMLLDERIWQRS